jgi:hypothetical protein
MNYKQEKENNLTHLKNRKDDILKIINEEIRRK